MIKQAEFMFSRAQYEENPQLNLPQIAVVGKSNVGKSSFINMLTDNSKLARVGKEPGRTRLINYFLINKQFILTDLPGYGYAKVSMLEKEKWAALIESYLSQERQLIHILFLVDIRHLPTADDMLMYDYMIRSSISFTIIATKSDKIPRSQLPAHIRQLSTALKVGEANIIPVSATLKTNKDKVFDKLLQILTYSPN